MVNVYKIFVGKLREDITLYNKNGS